MQRPVLAANWKMNHGPNAARAFVAEFTAKWPARRDRTVILFPPALSVSTVAAALGSRPDIGIGVQNIWTEDKGAFTGENSAPMARDAGARFALVGHSERRHVFGETDEQTALKCAAATRNELTPILCVGENCSHSARRGRPRRSCSANSALDWPSFRRPPSHRWRSRTSRSGQSAPARPRRRTTRPQCTPRFERRFTPGSGKWRCRSRFCMAGASTRETRGHCSRRKTSTACSSAERAWRPTNGRESAPLDGRR